MVLQVFRIEIALPRFDTFYNPFLFSPPQHSICIIIIIHCHTEAEVENTDPIVEAAMPIMGIHTYTELVSGGVRQQKGRGTAEGMSIWSTSYDRKQKQKVIFFKRRPRR
jgi:hypothetical protein